MWNALSEEFVSATSLIQIAFEQKEMEYEKI